MSEKTYFFVISIPRDQIIEYSTKLNSYISKLLQKEYACTVSHLEVREQDIISKILIKATEEDIRVFADRFFDKNYELIEREDGEIEITQKDADTDDIEQNQGLKH
ncbi:MAG: hypothetical protein AAF462_01050 [Thermodesulfobacteriota bacterium]